MNAIDFLVTEHEKVRKLLSDINSESHRIETKKKLFDKLAHDLIRHETMEHKIWYPCFKNHPKLDESIKYLLKEEKHAEKSIQKLQEITDDNLWEKNFTDFKKEVENHADDEEKKLFPTVRKILSLEELDNIGKEMYQFKKSYEE